MDTVIRIFRDIGINESVFLMFPLIILTFLLLKYQFFLPLRRVLDQREKVVGDADKEATEKRTLVEDRSSSLEEELRKARNEAFALRENTRADAEKASSEIIGQARESSTEELARVQSELEPLVSEARDRLGTEASALAELITQKILSGQIGAEQEGS